ncbi:putative magnesium transporter NIPA [Helianthus anomalus]
MYTSNLLGFGLAVSSSAFIGSSFIIKKKGLQRAGACGTRARSRGYGYLLEPLRWIGMLTMVKLGRMGIVGCVLCIVSSTVIVIHAPAEHSISSVEESWDLATQPAFLCTQHQQSLGCCSWCCIVNHDTGRLI